MSDAKLPAELGYRWPAEWEPHAATWCAWPHNRDSWPGKFEPVRPQFANMVRTLAQFEPVNVLAGGSEVLSSARFYLEGTPNVMLHDIETNDAWCRDHGPIFLTSSTGQSPALIDWEYNAWGGKYPPFDKDNAVPRQIAQRLAMRRFVPGIVLEGGAIDGNGCGTILTTEKCLLNPNRNGQLTKTDVERYLAKYLGARKVLWLREGDLAGDDTDGHVDQLARFVGPRVVVAAVENDPADENYQALQANVSQLQSMTDQEGAPLEVMTLPLPRAKYYADQRIPASYLNFYIANGCVIVPQYDDPADEFAVRTLGKLFPHRQVRGLPALHLAWGLGTFHCLTQQQPAAGC